LQVMRSLNGVGIEPLLMKGALYFFDGTLRDLGARFTGDLDVVVPRGRWEDSIQALRGAGYVPDPGKAYMHPHELPIVAMGTPSSVELHSALGSAGVARVLPVEEAWRSSRHFAVEGAHFRGLSATHAGLHNVLHGQVQDLNHAVFVIPLRQLHTLLCLQRTKGTEIDWEAIGDRLRHHGLQGAYTGHIDLAGRLLGMRVPVPVGPGARGHSLIALAMFQLRWPADLNRNLRFALNAEYLDHLYAHGHRLSPLLRARARHLYRALRAGGRTALADALLARR
ncbi:MAG: nucleotidyltransferase family protein, partial [Candidatus Dormibacteria bacterium]